MMFGTGSRVKQGEAQPATQPVMTEEQARTFYEQLRQTRLAQIMEGSRAISWDDIWKLDFWYDNIKDLIVTIVLFVPRLIGTVAFLFVLWLIYRGIRRVVAKSMKDQEVDSSIRDLMGGVIRWTVMGFGVVIACNQLGIPIVAMLTGVSIVGLAVGFAAQETLANFIAGIVIFLDKPFKVGDWIELDGTFGQVKRVTFRSTRVFTLDGEIHIFPNTHMLSNKLANHSTNPINRVSIPVGIAYRESIDEARKTLLAMFEGDQRVVKTPGPEVIVAALGDSSVNLVVRFWIADESIERRIGYEYTERAKNVLEAAGIEIPFPHMQLMIENTPASAARSATRAA
jgi:small conductance mechanosensitive channel